jgi:L-ascorbate metabolism protein UlaG (beta-lactamase superfamily)
MDLEREARSLLAVLPSGDLSDLSSEDLAKACARALSATYILPFHREEEFIQAQLRTIRTLIRYAEQEGVDVSQAARNEVEDLEDELALFGEVRNALKGISAEIARRSNR